MGPIAELDRMLAACFAYQGGAAFVSGAVGCGKTELLNAFLSRAGQAGATVLTASASAQESAPGSVLRALAAGLGEQPAGSAEPLWNRLGLDRSAPETPRELGERLLAAALRRPLVIGVDDVQHADEISLRGLLQLGARARSSRLLMVVTGPEAPPGGPSRIARWRADLRRATSTVEVPVAPLTRMGILEALTRQLGFGSARALSACFARLSGGNPLLVRALAEDYLVEDLRLGGPHGGDGSHGGDPDVQAAAVDRSAPRSFDPPGHGAFGRAVLTCLHRADDRLLATARGAAVLETAGSPALFAGLLEIGLTETGAALDTLASAGVMVGGGFRHPVARAAVLADLPLDEAVVLHRRAARLLRRSGAAARQVAAHLVAAGEADESWSVDLLRRAATDSADDDVTFAVECLRLAERASADPRERLSILIQQSRVECRVNPGGAIRRLPRLTRAIEAGEVGDRDLVMLVRALAWHGRVDEAAAALRRLDRDDVDLDEQGHAELAMARNWLRYSHPGVLVAAGAVRAGHGPRSMDPHPTRAARAVVLLGAVLAAGPDEATVPVADALLREIPPADETICPLESALVSLVCADRADLAAAHCDRLIAEADRRGFPTWRGLLAGPRAEIALRQGDLAAAERFARAALELIPAWSWGVGIGLPLSVLLRVGARTGTDPAGALAVPVPDEMFQTRYGLSYLYARGQRHAAVGQPHAALDDLLTCGRLMVRWGLDVPAFLPWRLDAAAVLAELGRLTQARDLLTENRGRPSAASPRVRGMALRVEASLVERQRRSGLLRESARLLGVAGDRLELARAREDLDALDRAAGSPRRGVTARPVLVAPPAGGGHEPGSARVSWSAPEPEAPTGPAFLLAVEGYSTAGGGELSTAELQVASLAATGHSNREIARRLYITVSTVEQHLTRTYRKLRIRGRAELPVFLGV
ncbi:helix-turn-helix domain-containing protein [Frankia sp. AgB1.9]|uniref:helix-turn-helix transcriptional regulator n=1 Tax=unclassified Frankia TaxID=2632575 RepID=UPI0019333795|nr:MULTISPECIES: LuxR family transcriptional regulator [unclassified Frankia]MBL7494163.1 helix-turn-helix domain-containing protein [Frankia sp. AgW1.1]MBL7551478.1 helix-turn-helix domain-containing protein [Frankia sp. AgB1.9]MBL7624693.1 helix-turn-helix domain-containing protein [Frankia sp. AgB1.8]